MPACWCLLLSVREVSFFLGSSFISCWLCWDPGAPALPQKTWYLELATHAKTCTSSSLRAQVSTFSKEYWSDVIFHFMTSNPLTLLNVFSISDEAISISSSSFSFIILSLPSWLWVTSWAEILLHHMIFAPLCGALYPFPTWHLHCTHRNISLRWWFASPCFNPWGGRSQSFLPQTSQDFSVFRSKLPFFLC